MLIKRTIKEGGSNYHPKHKRQFGKTKDSYTLKFKFDKDSWFHPTESSIGEDGKDWNKLGGVSTFNLFDPCTYLPNSTAALVGFRPSELKYHWEVDAYVNYRDTSWFKDSKILGTFPSDKEITLNYEYDNGYAIYEIDGTIEKIKFNPGEFQFNVGPTFGGNETSPVKGVVYTHQEAFNK